ncbi:hypothetical protein SAM40697_6840 [Streptomyces ambofaciens]|uniref:DUF5133 domain-containing protein n=1 Tax=Streptomyces ambofaciens TaxID=1889 RepID=Q0JWI7_STRAM|nr:DUF5133 domain-containing protein [Streptomyces ambofaciens]ANB04048.1 hypothetical protein SAM40697_0085 [Streptomyces ambofaciens]ANB10792.1 hypothetical protein SAM40697_6840 [Streptomyces ambofaciens]CAK50940.1 conserved hypothetical protein [Streptomyces ambofaciens]CAK51178.1 conserved hypothetical protein [Streptomyces ambofaciens]
MLMAHPAVLKDLIEQYETLQTLHAERGTEETRRRMEDVAYTLCVSTGTRDIDSAFLAARRRLDSAVPAQDGTLLTT